MKKTKCGDFESVIKFPAFRNFKIHVVFTKDIGESREQRYGTRGAADGADALHTGSIGGHSHLFFHPDAGEEVIAHEAYHAVHWLIMDFMGDEEMPDEIAAYLIGYVVGQIHRFKREL